MKLKGIGSIRTIYPFVSIIIPFHWELKNVNYRRFVKDLKKYLRLDYKNYEIILVSDDVISSPLPSKKIRLLYTKSKNPTSPAEKRDFALRHVRGEICAFIDDDAYPDKKWLREAVHWFINPDIIAVGGPGVTPEGDSFWQKIGGNILESYFCSGGIQYRFYPGAEAFVMDYPAYNLFIRTDILKKIGGYGSTFYGGEDTYLCIKLNKFGKILYDPGVVVYHHRREFPLGHLKQISNVGKHRGYFFKRYPENSRQLIYLLPVTLTFIFFIGIYLSIKFPQLFLVPFMLGLVLALFLASLSIYRHKVSILPSIASGLGIIVTHMVYGVYFLRGLTLRELKR